MKTLILVFFIAASFFRLFIEWKNIKHGENAPLPNDLAQVVDEKKFQEMRIYTKTNTIFAGWESLFNTFLFLGFFGFGGFGILDDYIRSFGFGSKVSGLFYVGVILLGSGILNLPFSIYHTFVIEARFGFNRTTWKVFIADLIKGIILSVLLGAPILYLVFWFFEGFALAWFYAWLAIILFQGILFFIAPIWIMPLFNKFTPLADGDLRNKIFAYAKKENFTLSNIFTMDGSKRSGKSNAFFTGIGKSRRIVLFDTLVEKMGVNELVSVLAHEVGHYKHKHILKMLFESSLTSLLMLFIFSLFLKNEQIFQAFQVQNLSTYMGLIIVSILYSPISAIFSVVGNFLSRKFEYEADAYAANTSNPDDMISALQKLSLENLSNLVPHPWKVFLDYSHPPVISRIQAIKKLALIKH